MTKNKLIKTILVILPVLLVGCLVYLPNIGKLGLIRDDWDNYYNALQHGADFLKEHYQSDRPADGVLLAEFFKVFGTDTTAYLIYNLVCRILGSLFFALALFTVFPRRPELAAIAGTLVLIFPGFLEQTMGFAYVPHQTAMCCFMLSLLLTALSFVCRKKVWRVILILLSAVPAFINMILMEYYIGMEIYRLLLILAFVWRENKKAGRCIAETLLRYLPYLLCALAFVFWRVFVFSAERVGADLMGDYITPILAHPRYGIGTLLMRILKSVWKLFAAVWTAQVLNLLDGLDMKPFVRVLAVSIGIAAAFMAVVILLARVGKKSMPEGSDEDSCVSLIPAGFLSGTAAILPMIIAGRDINFYNELDRFSVVGMIGAVLFLIGILFSIGKKQISFGITGVLITVFAFLQIQNKNNRIDQWQESKKFWQQLMWRAPMIEKDTTLIAHGTIPIQEDLDVSIPASLIYYPNEPDPEYIPLASETLYSGTVRKIRMGKQDERELRKIIVRKDFQKILAITKPGKQSCLRVIDGKNEIYSDMDGTMIPEIGAYSDINYVIDPGYSAAIPFFLGEEAEHDWCYYYEKMELALQMGDPETAAELADEAAALNLRTKDLVEWVPVIEAYSQVGRGEDAAKKWILFWENEYMRFSVCNYFTDKNDTETYGPVIEAFCR